MFYWLKNTMFFAYLFCGNRILKRNGMAASIVIRMLQIERSYRTTYCERLAVEKSLGKLS